ncbi:MAG: signal peptidase II [Chloroflexi bacterium]|nr:signal peptidase II [Chloroflexota bacterium]
MAEAGGFVNRLTFFLVALVILAGDQLSKWWISSHLLLGESLPPGGPFRLTYVTNTGSAFGLFANQTFLLILVGIMGMGVIFIMFRYSLRGEVWLLVSLGLQMGGAVGNLVDRIRLGYVVDFLDFRFWPAFNVADSAIVVGVGLLSLLLFLRKG